MSEHLTNWIVGILTGGLVVVIALAGNGQVARIHDTEVGYLPRSEVY